VGADAGGANAGGAVAGGADAGGANAGGTVAGGVADVGALPLTLVIGDGAALTLHLNSLSIVNTDVSAYRMRFSLDLFISRSRAISRAFLPGFSVMYNRICSSSSVYLILIKTAKKSNFVPQKACILSFTYWRVVILFHLKTGLNAS
jgi:hypothetical protein